MNEVTLYRSIPKKNTFSRVEASVQKVYPHRRRLNHLQDLHHLQERLHHPQAHDLQDLIDYGCDVSQQKA